MMIAEKIFMDWDSALKTVELWKSDGQTLVFTNGCFDIVHVGHVLYLEEAATLGSKLIVALNTDRSVRNLKGSERPLNTLADRMKVIAALTSTDMVISFDQETPYDLIKAIIPDVLVKGGDWPIDKIVGNDIVIQTGGKVVSLPFSEGFSTTSLVEKIKSL
ncbi:MAG: D-glycero-beta-D-manno-heptose 1-phosphate adenylyltransferase [Saprospiraceae bacterium]|nr:D-glycero-beta-D-manno-heptose 1-phosphate adenylyltransferase [Saprospiraceae bacterium]